MKRRILSIIMVLALCLTLLPGMALAEGESEDALAKISLEEENKNGDGWSWDGANKTLTLENCNLTFQSDGFHLPSGTTVLVKGSNSIIAGANHQSGTALWAEGSAAPEGTDVLTIKSGSDDRGSLNIACEKVNSNSSKNGSITVWNGGKGNLVFENVDITVAGDNNMLKGPNVVVDNAAITVEASEHGTPDDTVLYGVYDVTIKNNSVITVETKNATWGICANDNDLTITDSTVSLTETFDQPSDLSYLGLSCYGLQGCNNVVITNSEIDIQMTMTEAATSSNVREDANICGIVAGYQDISIVKSQVTVTTTNVSHDDYAYNYGIVSYDAGHNSRGNISITDNSQLTLITNGVYPIGIIAAGCMTVNNSTVTSTAANSGQGGFALEMLSYGEFELIGVEVIQGTKYSSDGEEDITATEGFDPTQADALPTGGTSIIGPSVTGVTLDKDPLKLTVGSNEKLTATVTPDNAAIQDVTWSSSDNTIATVDEKGVVTAVAPGTATITVTTASGTKTASCTVTVKKPQDALTISGVPDKVYPNDSFTLTAEGGSGDGAISWSVVSGPARIDQKGKVTVTGTGEVTVKAVKAENTEYTQADCSVTFTAVSKPSSSDGSGSSGTPIYPPVVDNSERGSVAVKPASPKQGDKVTIMPTPDKGFAADAVTVTDRNGNPVKVTDNGDGTYRFTQPAGKVTISVSFVCDGLTERCPSCAYTDLDTTAWYHLAVDDVLNNDLMQGIGGGHFAPDAILTRAELAQILYNNEDHPAVSGDSVFADVASDAWYTDAVVWANEKDLVAGYGDGNFGPNDPITREQLVVILWRYVQYKGYDVSVGENTNILSYQDIGQLSEYAFSAMQWAAGADVINGYEDGTLNPKGNATRTQLAQMLMTYCENVEKS